MCSRPTSSTVGSTSKAINRKCSVCVPLCKVTWPLWGSVLFPLEDNEGTVSIIPFSSDVLCVYQLQASSSNWEMTTKVWLFQKVKTKGLGVHGFSCVPCSPSTGPSSRSRGLQTSICLTSLLRSSLRWLLASSSYSRSFRVCSRSCLFVSASSWALWWSRNSSSIRRI